MTLALLCSGQGHQNRGMFDLYADQPSAAPILAEASALLGGDARTLLQTIDNGALHANRTSQILCVARGLAAAACLPPVDRTVVAGYSVGEMTAWGVAGVWSPEQTLRLTAVRAEAMDAAGGTGDGLGYVRGLSPDHMEILVARFECAIAIVNPARVFVFGGPHREIERCCEAALKAGAAAARPINVNIASHTPRLAAAAAPFRAALDASVSRPPHSGCTLIGAADASIISDVGRSVSGLAAQIDTKIDWSATLETLIERGVNRILELGPGTALADMARAAYPMLDARGVDDFRAVAGIATWIEQDRGHDR